MTPVEICESALAIMGRMQVPNPGDNERCSATNIERARLAIDAITSADVASIDLAGPDGAGTVWGTPLGGLLMSLWMVVRQDNRHFACR